MALDTIFAIFYSEYIKKSKLMPISYFQKLFSPVFWKKSRPSYLGFIVLVGVAVIVLFFVNSASKISLPGQIEISKKPKTGLLKILPIASGKQTYDIVTDNSQKLKIIEVAVDPLDVKQGETQIVTIKVKDEENNPITQENQVEAIVYTDNTSSLFSFSLKNVSDSDAATIALWQGSWVCEDTYNLKYLMTVKAKSAKGEHSIDLSFR